MPVSVVKVVLICMFLAVGMVLGGLLMQPKSSTDVWNIKESDFPINDSSHDKLSFLLNYAILAPSIDSTQPWKFNVSGDEIRLFTDKAGWLTIADADQRELYISEGCALENLLVAAEHYGYRYNVTYPSGNGSLVAVIKLFPGSMRKTDTSDTKIFEAILNRHANQNPYVSKEIPESALQKLQDIASDRDAELSFTSDVNTRNDVRNLTVSADERLYSDPNYKSELGHWLGRGMMGPTGIEAVLAQFRVLFLDISTDLMKKDADLLNSTQVLGFISTDRNDRVSQIRAGQLLERVWLEATTMGISIQPMNQALEVPETKAKLMELMRPESGNLQQVFTLGYASSIEEHTPRISVKDSIVPMNWSQTK